MDKPIFIRQFAKRWYLCWAHSGQTIAYGARRAMIEYNKTGGKL